jgi:hypothetical protein
MSHFKMIVLPRCWWFTTIILATQEEEIRMISAGK